MRQWGRCLLKLLHIGKHRGIDSLIDIEHRLTEVSEAKKIGIFNSIYLWETVKFVKANAGIKIKENDNYNLNEEVYSKHMLMDPYSDYYIKGLKAANGDPIENITEEKTDNSDDTDEVSEVKYDQIIEIEDIWDITMVKMKYQVFDFELTEKFMYGVIFKSLVIDGPKSNVPI